MKALLLVDLQVDFCALGALEVPDGDAVIPLANQLMPAFDLVVATKDWHPANHGSFAANHPWRKPGQVIDLHGLPQVLWPIHCVQGIMGADFHAALHQDGIDEIIHKGTMPSDWVSPPPYSPMLPGAWSCKRETSPRRFGRWKRREPC